MSARVTDAPLIDGKPLPIAIDGDSLAFAPVELRVGSLWQRVASHRGVAVYCSHCGADLGTQYKPGDSLELFAAHRPLCTGLEHE